MRGTEPVTSSWREVRFIPVGAVLLLLFVLICVSQVPSVAGVSTSSSSRTTTTSSSSIPANVTGDITIDKSQFATTVPSYALLGENYTLRIVIRSNVSIAVPVIVQLSVPVEAIFVHPRVVRMDIPPMNFMVANFTILPFGPPRAGPYTVTALLYVFFPASMSSPLLVDQATAMVLAIGPNPYPYLDVVLVSAVIVTLVLVAVFYPGVFRKGFATISR